MVKRYNGDWVAVEWVVCVTDRIGGLWIEWWARFHDWKMCVLIWKARATAARACGPSRWAAPALLRRAPGGRCAPSTPTCPAASTRWASSRATSSFCSPKNRSLFEVSDGRIKKNKEKNHSPVRDCGSGDVASVDWWLHIFNAIIDFFDRLEKWSRTQPRLELRRKPAHRQTRMVPAGLHRTAGHQGRRRRFWVRFHRFSFVLFCFFPLFPPPPPRFSVDFFSLSNEGFPNLGVMTPTGVVWVVLSGSS